MIRLRRRRRRRGVIGQAIAYELVSRGASVTLLDCRGAGLGCDAGSSGNAGAVPRRIRPSASAARRAKASRCTTHSSSAFRAMPEWASDIAARDRCRWRPATTRSKSLRQHRRRAARAAGVDCELLDAKRRESAEPQLTPDVSRGLFVRSHGFVVAARSLGSVVGCGDQARCARPRSRRESPRIDERGD